MKIPLKGLPKGQVLGNLHAYKSRDRDWKAGKVWGYVYQPGDGPADVVKEAYLSFMSENGLDPTVFPSLLKLETDVVRMLANLLGGDREVVGHVTSGGTESIILAVKTARDMARKQQPWIEQPEMVLPITAHAAFHKAAHYLGLKPVVVGIDPGTFEVEAESMRSAITGNTILLVASAPNYSQGVVDPIREIGEIALDKGLLFHVDACVGGIHLSFMRSLGYEVPDFDFGVPGVTSLSVDMHKYGYAAKGVSTILYRNKEIRKHQIFASTDTTGYTLLNPTILSSKSGGPMAGAWAILNYLGEEGFKGIITSVQDATRRLIDGINAIPELEVLGQPVMCMFSFKSDTINVFQLADAMAKRGWYIQSQFSTPLTPRNLHISVNYGTVHQVDAFLRDLDAGVREVKESDPLDSASIRAMVAETLQHPDPEAAFALLAQSAGITGSHLPEETAFINEVLDALPDELANSLLIDFFNDLYV